MVLRIRRPRSLKGNRSKNPARSKGDLCLPDFYRARAAVLTTLSSPNVRLCYRFPIDDFIRWHCSNRRLGSTDSPFLATGWSWSPAASLRSPSARARLRVTPPVAPETDPGCGRQRGLRRSDRCRPLMPLPHTRDARKRKPDHPSLRSGRAVGSAWPAQSAALKSTFVFNRSYNQLLCYQ